VVRAADIPLVEIRLSEIIAALSHALDVTGGQPMGHAERSCVIGLRLADAAGFDAGQRASLFYALLLKDAGCSTNSAATAATYGTSDFGAEIARCLDLDEDTAAAIGHLDEHWDGGGYPAGLAGEDISPLARVMSLAQTMEVFWQQGGPQAASAVARERRGTWFYPALVDAVAAFEHEAAFWASLTNADVNALEPVDRVQRADDARLDRVAEAFAGIVDAKSPFTARHSASVAAIAEGIADTMGLDAAARRLLRRAGLLHDVGKLGVSDRILDKPCRLTDDEWAAVRRHPELSLAILSPVPALADIARLAVEHHERLDGSGYPYGLVAHQLDISSRVLQVADVAEALSARRPYREAMDADAVPRVMGGDADSKLDAVAFGALEAWLPREGARTLVDAA
jgi:putative nucleotidyltransferase with HDIG domain